MSAKMDIRISIPSVIMGLLLYHWTIELSYAALNELRIICSIIEVSLICSM